MEVADGGCFTYGSTEVRFSRPHWHGVEGSKLGYVLMVTIDDGEERLLHTSDMDGPVLREVTEEIIEVDPHLLIVDGQIVGLGQSAKHVEMSVQLLLPRCQCLPAILPVK